MTHRAAVQLAHRFEEAASRARDARATFSNGGHSADARRERSRGREITRQRSVSEPRARGRLSRCAPRSRSPRARSRARVVRLFQFPRPGRGRIPRLRPASRRRPRPARAVVWTSSRTRRGATRRGPPRDPRSAAAAAARVARARRPRSVPRSEERDDSRPSHAPCSLSQASARDLLPRGDDDDGDDGDDGARAMATATARRLRRLARASPRVRVRRVERRARGSGSRLLRSGGRAGPAFRIARASRESARIERGWRRAPRTARRGRRG